MAEDQGRHLLTEKDFVDVIDEEGNDLGYQVPKHWTQDDLPAGAKKKSRGSSSTGSNTPPAARAAGEEPKGNASTDEWIAFAREKGATDADLLDDDGNALGQKALREKYGTPTS